MIEDLHSRVKIIESDLAEDDTYENTGIARNRIRKAWNTPEARKSANHTSTIRITLIASILFAFFYVYFFTDFIS